MYQSVAGKTKEPPTSWRNKESDLRRLFVVELRSAGAPSGLNSPPAVLLCLLLHAFVPGSDSHWNLGLSLVASSLPYDWRKQEFPYRADEFIVVVLSRRTARVCPPFPSRV